MKTFSQASTAMPADEAQSSTALGDEPIPYTLNAILVEALADLTAQPGHFAWCGPNACVTSHFRNGQTITEHFSAPVRLAVPARQDIGVDYLLSSQVFLDDTYADPTVFITTGDEDSGEAGLDGPQTDTFCDAMQAFVDGVRAQRRQFGGQAREVEPGHFAWCADCTPSVNAVAGRPRTEHIGTPLSLNVPAGMDLDGETTVLEACIAVDDGFVGVGTEISFGCMGSGMFLNAETAPKMLAALEAFTAGFKTMVAQLPAERQS